MPARQVAQDDGIYKRMNILSQVKQKKILILGLGREGLSTYLFLRKQFPDKILTLADKFSLNERNRIIQLTGFQYENYILIVLIFNNGNILILNGHGLRIFEQPSGFRNRNDV